MTAAQIIAAVNTHGSISRAAAALGVSRPTLHYHIKRLGLEVGHQQQSLTWIKTTGKPQ